MKIDSGFEIGAELKEVADKIHERTSMSYKARHQKDVVLVKLFGRRHCTWASSSVARILWWK